MLQKPFFWFFLFSTCYCDCSLRFTANSFFLPVFFACGTKPALASLQPWTRALSPLFPFLPSDDLCRTQEVPVLYCSHYMARLVMNNSCIWHYVPGKGSSRLNLSPVVSFREEFTSLLQTLTLGRISCLQPFSENCVHKTKLEKCSLKCFLAT